MEDTSWLYNLRPVNFEYKNRIGQKQYGLIAEEVNEINDYFIFKVDGEIESIDYKKLITPMLNEVQKLNSEITRLNDIIVRNNLS
jgi:hypothetical protein